MLQPNRKIDLENIQRINRLYRKNELYHALSYIITCIISHERERHLSYIQDVLSHLDIKYIYIYRKIIRF